MVRVIISGGTAMSIPMPIPFVGRFWNNTDWELGIQRIHLKDWDPEQLAYFTVSPGQMVAFTSRALVPPPGETSWIQAQILNTKTNETVSRFTLNRNYVGSNCSIILQTIDNITTKIVSDQVGWDGTTSFTIWQWEL
jgi:hypothetical protein